MNLLLSSTFSIGDYLNELVFFSVQCDKLSVLVSSEQDEIGNSKITMPNHKVGEGGGEGGILDSGMCLLHDKRLISIHIAIWLVTNKQI